MLEKIARLTRLDRVKLTYLSLVKSALIVFLIYGALSYLQSINHWGLSPLERAASIYRQEGLKPGEKFLTEYLRNNPVDVEAWMLLIQKRGHFIQIARAIGRAPLQEKEPNSKIFDPTNQNPLIIGGDDSNPLNNEPFLPLDEFTKFLDKAESPEPAALQLAFKWYSHHPKKALKVIQARNIPEKIMLGQLLSRQKNKKAFELFKSVLQEDPDNLLARQLELQLKLSLGWKNDFVKTIQSDERYYQAADAYLRFDYHLEVGEYLETIPWLLEFQYGSVNTLNIFFVLWAGMGWILFMMHMGQAWNWPRPQLSLIFIALILGALSTGPVIWLASIQSHITGHEDSTAGLLFNLAYAILGIGLREELLKLLLFLPLLPFAIRSKSNLLGLILASFVGLGFALEENVNYLYRDLKDAAPGRFLTANFLHMALTGYIGYYLTKWLRKDGAHWNDFLDAFLLMVLCHGAYDFVIMEPSLAELSWLSMTILIWVSMRYFQIYSEMHIPFPRKVSLTRVFVLALSSALGAGFVYLNAYFGLQGAFKILASEMLGLAFIVYMFFYVIGEPIAKR